MDFECRWQFFRTRTWHREGPDRIAPTCSQRSMIQQLVLQHLLHKLMSWHWIHRLSDHYFLSCCDFWLGYMMKCCKLSDWLVNSTTAVKPAGQTLFYCVICSMMMIWLHAFNFQCVCSFAQPAHTCQYLLLLSPITVNNTVIILGVLTFALQLCLVLFILLRCWQLDSRIKAALKSPDSVNKPSGEYFLLYCLPVWLELVISSIN